MYENSLERLSQSIYSGKSKEYFREVLSSYNSENYRSAVVMLWSVAICDIVYKLQNLIDLYADTAAGNILADVTQLQSQDARSSAWEIQLLDDVHQKTNLLDTAEYENLRYLQRQRHLSAHPILNSERELHSPNKETVRALIRNTLQGLLTKPPIYTQRILNELLEDIEESTNVLNTREKIKRYTESRYFSRTTATVEKNLLRSLWKIVFKLQDENCVKNRLINFRVLEILSDRNISSLPDEIEGESDFYSNVASNGHALSYLVYYLANNPQIYSLLNEDAHLKIEHCIRSDEVGKTMGWFIKTDLDTHRQDVDEWIRSDQHPTFTEEQFDALLKISDTEEWERSFCQVVSTYYTVSSNYNDADIRYQVAIPKYISLFDKDSIVYLAKQINESYQCYSRSSARSDYALIKDRIETLFGDNFDFTDLENFQRKIASR